MPGTLRVPGTVLSGAVLPGADAVASEVAADAGATEPETDTKA